MITSRLQEVRSIKQEPAFNWIRCNYYDYSIEDHLKMMNVESNVKCTMDIKTFEEFLEIMMILDSCNVFEISLEKAIEKAIEKAEETGRKNVSLDEAYEICLNKTPLFRDIFEGDDFCSEQMKNMIRDKVWKDKTSRGLVRRKDIVIDEFKEI